MFARELLVQPDEDVVFLLHLLELGGDPAPDGADQEIADDARA